MAVQRENRGNGTLVSPDEQEISEILSKACADAKTPIGADMLLPAYSGISTFFRAPHESGPSGLDIALIGVPFDGGLTNRPGARYGPRAVRDNSLLSVGINHQSKIFPAAICRIGDIGDVPIGNSFLLDESIREIRDFYRDVAGAGAAPVSAGGDHSITYPILSALGRDGPIGLIHFDAHCDTGPAYYGSKFHHGGPFRNAVEEGVLDSERTIQIGIRGRSEILWDFSYRSGMRVMHIEEYYELGWKKVVQEIRKVVGTGPVYVSVDIDCLDPAFAPGTGTPEVGGITPFELQQMLRGLQGLNLIGGDVVEVSPPFDPAGVTALNGAAMMFEILCIVAAAVASRSPRPRRVDPGAWGVGEIA